MYYKKWIGYICRDDNNGHGNVSKAKTDPEWVKWIHRELSDRHCQECLRLDGCWFLKAKAPQWPHHLFCHCTLRDVPYIDVLNKCTSDSAYSKFDPYLFDTNGDYAHGKDELFRSWGYSVEDAEFLKAEIEKQALEKYINGSYELGKLNDKGQRISIQVEIARKDTGSKVSFKTGWMVYPDGHIQLTTPYGGK